MRTKILILTAFTLVNAIIMSCGQDIKADGGYRLEFMFDRRCITNDVSIWCD